MSTLEPSRAAVAASAAVTVVFPTPPLPATMTTWEAEQKRATSIPACYERPMRTPRARVRTVAVAALVFAALAACVGAGGAATRDGGTRGIVIVQVNGLLDPPNAALITKSLHDAEKARASLVAFQLSASGAVDVDVDSLVQAIT